MSEEPRGLAPKAKQGREGERSVHSRYSEVKPFVTKDNSIIRELMHPGSHGNTNQSLAEATVPVGVTTILHRHHQSEEIYHITAGQGLMRLGAGEFQVNRLLSQVAPHVPLRPIVYPR